LVVRIYMEVDGVINALQAPNLWGPKTFDSIDFGGYTFVWSTEAVASLEAMCSRDDVEIVWLTTWSSNINVLARLLGFGHVFAEARVIEEIEMWSTPFEKADALLRDLEENPLSGGWMWLDSVSDDVMQSTEYVERMVMENGYVPPISDVVGISPSMVKYMSKRIREDLVRKTPRLPDGRWNFEKIMREIKEAEDVDGQELGKGEE